MGVDLPLVDQGGRNMHQTITVVSYQSLLFGIVHALSSPLYLKAPFESLKAQEVQDDPHYYTYYNICVGRTCNKCLD